MSNKQSLHTTNSGPPTTITAEQSVNKRSHHPHLDPELYIPPRDAIAVDASCPSDLGSYSTAAGEQAANDLRLAQGINDSFRPVSNVETMGQEYELFGTKSVAFLVPQAAEQPTPRLSQQQRQNPTREVAAHTDDFLAPVLIESLSLPSLAAGILTRPQFALAQLARKEEWIWVLPIALALLFFYLRFFVMMYLEAPLLEWTLMGGVIAILVGLPFRAVVLYGCSRYLSGYPRFGLLLGLSAWATLPLVLRDLVQSIYMLATGTLLTHQGLSGLLASSGDLIQSNSIGHYWLANADLYTLWHLLLLTFAVRIGGNLSMRNAIYSVAVYVMLILSLGSMAQLL